jgi:hypothetical protein
VRLVLMASLDGEGSAPSASDQQHLSTCASCQLWLTEMTSLAAQLQELPYPRAQVDLSTRVDERIHLADHKPGRLLLPIAAGVVAWRALQLFIDVPLPILHPLVPLAAVAVAVWRLAGDPLAIETLAPELKESEVSNGIA